MMLGLLLARAGVDVLVLEEYADFLRDFRGDTMHPSTLELMHDLGILGAFLARPHQPACQLDELWIGGELERPGAVRLLRKAPDGAPAGAGRGRCARPRLHAAAARLRSSASSSLEETS